MNTAQRLTKARQQMIALPALMAELSRCLDEHQATEGGGHRKITGSPAPLRLDVLHLIDERLKPDWHGTDPRRVDVANRFGVLGVLASWVRIVWEESDLLELADPPSIASETVTLLEWWPWIAEQPWAGEMADDILAKAGEVRSALGEVKLLLRCPQCADHAFIDGLWLVCDSGHETSVRDLAQQQRRRPAMEAKDLAVEFNLDPATFRQWHKREKLEPVNPGRKPLLYRPWDVLRLVNPDLVAAAEARDDVPA